jgi:peptide methionine sulfoxide reductase MsrB
MLTPQALLPTYRRCLLKQIQNKSSERIEEIDCRIKHNKDALCSCYGRRIEIVGGNSDGHLGHVFKGGRFTAKNTRNCVNLISMKFKKD